MKIKIILITLIAFGAMVSLAFSQINKKDKITNVEQTSTRTSGFVSEEI
jgi:hypothetical protein